VTAAGAFAVGAALYGAAAGKVDDVIAGSIIGYAVEAATADGDIVKIIVTPFEDDDIINLIAFTHAIKKPLCTGVMGTRFRYARAILPLFGSHLVYCHAGAETAEGQYSVDEFVRLMALLTGSP